MKNKIECFRRTHLGSVTNCERLLLYALLGKHSLLGTITKREKCGNEIRKYYDTLYIRVDYNTFLFRSRISLSPHISLHRIPLSRGINTALAVFHHNTGIVRGRTRYTIIILLLYYDRYISFPTFLSPRFFPLSYYTPITIPLLLYSYYTGERGYSKVV